MQLKVTWLGAGVMSQCPKEISPKRDEEMDAGSELFSVQMV